jgi:hypothetical protein
MFGETRGTLEAEETRGTLEVWETVAVVAGEAVS